MKVLILDDEPQIRRLLHTGLSGLGYTVITAAHAEQVAPMVAQYQPDFVVLDINLNEKRDGIDVVRELREWTTVPILMLSVKEDDKTIVRALDAGADDYLTKPFDMGVLRARITAVLRRTPERASGTPVSDIRVGALEVDLGNRRVTVDGEDVHLTPKEYEILVLLATHPGKVITHRQILSRVWGDAYGEETHYVRVFVNQIRKKLKEEPENAVRYILNEPGIGYRFVMIES
ncbi:MAG: response regulator transcription factor [Chloroflexi bacterium]|nr:response regulator transcription factor [Chloroflexota bacterium]